MRTSTRSTRTKAKKTKGPGAESRLEEAGDSGDFISGPPRLHLRSARLELGEIISDRFEPKHRIHCSAEGLVCLAFDRIDQRDVALKVRRQPDPGESGVGTVLRREAAIGRCLPDHPNILEYYDLHYLPGGDGRRLALLSMQYADGGSLRQWLQKQGRVEEADQADGLEHFLSLCLGVAALHERGILHLDLKPENLLLCSGVLKIADFGAAWASSQDLNGDEPDLKPLLSASTPNYMSPEQFTARRIEELTPASDVYALGVNLYEIHNPAHRPPFIGSHQHLCLQHQSAPVPALPGVGKELNKVIRRCMAKKPRDRFGSVDELIDAVRHIESHRSRETGQEGETSPANPPAIRQPDNPLARESATALYEEIARGLDDVDLDELLALAAKAAELCPNHPQTEVTLVRLDRRVKTYSENIGACMGELGVGRLETALRFAQRAGAANHGSVFAQRLMARLSEQLERIGGLKAELLNAVRAGDLDRAQALAVDLDELGVEADPALLTIGGAE